MQLHQWQLWQGARLALAEAASAPRRALSLRILELEPSRSALQGEVSAALRELLSLPTAEEVRTEHGVMLDAVVTCEDGTEVAIEVDGRRTTSSRLCSRVAPRRRRASSRGNSLNGGTC